MTTSFMTTFMGSSINLALPLWAWNLAAVPYLHAGPLPATFWPPPFFPCPLDAWELQIDYPILQVRLFKHNTGFAFSNLAAMINYSATYAVTFLLSVYPQVVRGYDSQAAGLILLAQPLVMTILSPLAGTLSDRLEPKLVASLGMGCSALTLFFSTDGRIKQHILHMLLT